MGRLPNAGIEFRFVAILLANRRELTSDSTNTVHSLSRDQEATRILDLELVEVNDGYSLSPYGLESMEYAELLEARWLQLVGA